jgi:hypothetical protein
MNLCRPLIVAVIFCAAGFSQQLPSSTAHKAHIDFTFENPNVEPTHYTLTVDRDGGAEYNSGRPEDSANSAPEKFKLSAATRDRIFELAKSVNYFDGDWDFKKHRVAFSGTRTFTYAEAETRHSTKFNWTENPTLSELSGIFEGISATLESETKLNYLRRYDKLGLNAQLARMEQMAKSGWLKELQLLSQVLNQVANDPSVMNIARERAQKLGRMADGAASK